MSQNKVLAIALCRVSTKRQLLDGNLEPQEIRVIEAAKFREVTIPDDAWWRKAISGKRGNNVNRKDLNEMEAYCRRHKAVKYLIIDEPDRFMRSLPEYYYWKVKFGIVGVSMIRADKPEVDLDDPKNLFDEMIDVYKAEASNQERIKKTPEKQKSKIMAGYYPSNPHTGYKKSDVPGLHEPDEPNWSAMQKAFRAMAAGEIDIHEGLKRATADGLRTKNYGPGAVGGRKIDMYRWKALMIDPYYCGLIVFSDWDLGREVTGLHKPMITREEHEILVAIVKNKGKRFIMNRNNPEFLLSNEAECLQCALSEYEHPRLVGYWQNNGKEKGYKRYRRYRCRACNLGIRQEELHRQLTEELSQILLTPEQKEKLKERARKIWGTYEKERMEKARVALGKVAILKDKKSNLVNSLAANPELAEDIKEELENVKIQIVEAEKVAAEAQDFEKDFDEFICYAFNIMDNLKDNWWQLDKKTMRLYKQLLFPAGIQLLPDKKVYIREVSPIYSYENQKKPRSEANLEYISRLEGPVGFEPTTPSLKGSCSNLLSYGPSSACDGLATSPPAK